jgi:outer membrane biosynthesis protein TonB
MRARIQGKVKLEVSVDVKTGDVWDVRVVLGHPIFLDAVKEAIRQWQFAEQPGGDMLRVPVDLVFEWHCPESAAN